jgi:hypothetical protein
MLCKYSQAAGINMSGSYSQYFQARIYTTLGVKEYSRFQLFMTAIKSTTKASSDYHLKLYRVEEVLESKKYCIDLDCKNEPDSVMEEREKPTDNIPEFREHLVECLKISGVKHHEIFKIIFFIGPNQVTLNAINDTWLQAI